MFQATFKMIDGDYITEIYGCENLIQLLIVVGQAIENYESGCFTVEMEVSTWPNNDS